MGKLTHIVSRFLGSASLWSIIGTGLRVGGSLITLPLALKTIPSAQMGLFYTFSAITGLAALLDFGFAPAISRNAAYAMGGARRFSPKGLPEMSGDGTPNWVLLDHLRQAVQKWYWGVGCLLAIGLLVFGTAFIHQQIVRASLPGELLYCWLVFAATAIYGFVTLYWQDLLVGIGRVTEMARIGVTAQVIALAAIIAGLLLGHGLWSYAAGGFLGSCIGRVLCKRTFLQKTERVENKIEWSTIQSVFGDLWPMAWRQGLVMLGAFLIQRGNTLISSEKLGLEETASYGLSVNLLTLLLQLSMIPLAMAWPEIGRLRVQQRIPEIKRIFFTRTYLGLGGALVCILAGSLAGPLVLAWMGSKTHILPSSLFILLGLIWLLESHHSAYGSLVLSGNQNPFLLPAILSGAAIFSISWWAASKWGLSGLIISQGAVQLAWNNWWTVRKGFQSLKPSRA